MKITKPRNMPPRPIPALLCLDQPESQMLLVGQWCHIICGSKTLYVNPNTIDAMIARDWIPTCPLAITQGVAVYPITPKGRASAKRLREDQLGYQQLEFDITELQMVS